MRAEPRIGDTVLSADRMEPFVVTDHSTYRVSAKSIAGNFARVKRRTFAVDRLELIDHDEGLWQEMEAPNE